MVAMTLNDLFAKVSVIHYQSISRTRLQFL